MKCAWGGEGLAQESVELITQKEIKSGFLFNIFYLHGT